MSSTIHTHRWYPQADTTAKAKGVYLLHGIGEHAGRYERLATYLCNQGFIVGAHDHPGHGKSSGKRGVIGSFDELELTAAEQLEQFENEIGSKAYLFGHSMGGLVATSMLVNHNVEVPGLILSAPAFSPIVSRFNRLKLAVLNVVAPHFSQQLPSDITKLSHDEDEQQKAKNDPLNHRYKSVGIVMWLIKIGKLTLERANKLNTPTLLLLAGGDTVVNPKAWSEFSNSVNAGVITEKMYGDSRHEILNETPERRNQAMADIAQWLGAQGTK